MEPLQLSLNQVNFETYDLGENSADEEPLHSFSNLVSYEWDLKSPPENDGVPVKAKKVAQSTGDEWFMQIIMPVIIKNKMYCGEGHYRGA